MYTHAQKTHKWSLKQKKKINDAIHLREASSGAAESSTSSCTSESRVSVTMFRGETEEETRRLDHTYEYSDVPVPVVRRICSFFICIHVLMIFVVSGWLAPSPGKLVRLRCGIFQNSRHVRRI